MKQDKQSFCELISRREKDGARSNISNMVCFIMVDMSFNTDGFVLVSAKFKYHILLQGISDATNMVMYQVVTIEKSE